MKKFMKGTAITGGIFFLIGLVVLLIGIGGGGIKDMREKSMAELERVMEKFENIEFIDGINITFEGTNIFDENIESYTDGTYVFEDCMASDLEILVGAGDLKIKYHNEENVTLEVSDEDKMQCYVEGDTLKIRGSLITGTGSSSTMIVYLPENKNFNNVAIDVGAGNIEIDKLTGSDTDINVAMGQVVISEMETDSLNIEVGMGNAEVKGNINYEAIVDCGMGQVVMELEGEGKDFNYNLDCGLGSLSVEGVYHIAGIGDSYVNNDASMEMDISVGMGTVTVSFEE